ncbi:hypothetical protein [Halobacteriaceae bacterium SHR40]|uniref:hypothetical protein n=1 Tax=Halovenus amylolytica TaxID=2500550 RepID=UPI000FE3D422
MRQTTVLGALVVAAVLLVAAPAAGLAADNASTALQQADSANETAPGEQLSGVVGVSEAEMEGDLDRRAFGLQIANASTQQAQADVVAERVTDVDQRLDELEDRKEKLDRQRDAGEISDGKYSAQMARLAAETETVKDLSNQSAQVAGELPADILEDRGVNATKIQQLSERAGELSGPEVAEIARGIAGDRIGETPGGDRPIDVPDRPERPGDRPGNDRPGDGQNMDESPDDESTDDDQPDRNQTGNGQSDRP